MGNSTSNLNLYKPDRTDYVSVITDINNNMDKIDAHAGTINGRFSGGVLKPENGGTGQTTARGAMNSFINSLENWSSQVPSDADYFISQYKDGGTSNTNYYRRPIVRLWDYIKSKFMPNGYVPVDKGGTGKTTAPDAMNAFINALPTGSDVPVDADYFISQYKNGGTANTTYYRRPISKLFEYMLGKLVLAGTASGGYTWLNGVFSDTSKMWFVVGSATGTGGFSAFIYYRGAWRTQILGAYPSIWSGDVEVTSTASGNNVRFTVAYYGSSASEGGADTLYAIRIK